MGRGRRGRCHRVADAAQDVRCAPRREAAGTQLAFAGEQLAERTAIDELGDDDQAVRVAHHVDRLEHVLVIEAARGVALLGDHLRDLIVADQLGSDQMQGYGAAVSGGGAAIDLGEHTVSCEFGARVTTVAHGDTRHEPARWRRGLLGARARRCLNILRHRHS